jgi:hypothetical protein
MCVEQRYGRYFRRRSATVGLALLIAIGTALVALTLATVREAAAPLLIGAVVGTQRQRGDGAAQIGPRSSRAAS